MTPIENEKLVFLKEKTYDQNLKIRHTLKVDFFGLIIDICFSNLSNSAFQYLKKYYSPFLSLADNSDFVVHYHSFEDSRRTLDHPWYCERYPNIHYQDHENNILIIERDYCAIAEKNFNSLRAFGPEPSELNPDSLDNLLALIFSSSNQKHQGMLLHSATVIKDEEAYIFFGKSGAGKSTLAFHCYKSFNQKIISSDQSIVFKRGEQLFVQATPITIPELPRDCPERTWKAYPVKGLIHLVRRNQNTFEKKSSKEIFKPFLEQSQIYLTPFTHQQSYLDLASEVINAPHILTGELSYIKDSNFWKHIPL